MLTKLRRGVRLALTVFIMLVWATCYVVIKAGLRETTPLFFAALRTLPAGAVLLLVARLRGRAAPSGGAWGWIVLLGFFNVVLGFGGMFLGTGGLATGIAAVLNNSQPLIVAVLAAVLLGERLHAVKAAGLGLGFAGVTVAALSSARGTGGDPVGIWVLLISAVGLAAASVIVKYVSRRGDVLTLTAWQFLVGGLILLGAAAGTEDLSATVWTAGFLAALGYLSLIGTALTFLLWFWLIRDEEVSRLSAFTFLVPVVALVLGMLFYREVITATQAVGALLGLAGIVVVSVSKEDRRDPEPVPDSA